MPNTYNKIKFVAYEHFNKRETQQFFDLKKVEIVKHYFQYQLTNRNQILCYLQENFDYIYFFCKYDINKQVEGNIVDFDTKKKYYLIDGQPRFIPFFDYNEFIDFTDNTYKQEQKPEEFNL